MSTASAPLWVLELDQPIASALAQGHLRAALERYPAPGARIGQWFAIRARHRGCSQAERDALLWGLPAEFRELEDELPLAALVGVARLSGTEGWGRLWSRWSFDRAIEFCPVPCPGGLQRVEGLLLGAVRQLCREVRAGYHRESANDLLGAEGAA